MSGGFGTAGRTELVICLLGGEELGRFGVFGTSQRMQLLLSSAAQFSL